MAPQRRLLLALAALGAAVAFVRWWPRREAAPAGPAADAPPAPAAAALPATGAAAGPEDAGARDDVTPPAPPAARESAPLTEAGLASAVAITILPVEDLLTARGDAAAFFTNIADLVASLQEATDPRYWREQGVGIRSTDSGHLEVTASLFMQRQVAQVLADLRRLAASRGRGR